MGTLVLCVDRSATVARAAGLETPVIGWEAVRSLVIEVGLNDPENARVNSLLEALRVTRELRDGGDDDATVAVISGSPEGVVNADRSVARQAEEIIETEQPDSAVVVVDSARDEQVVPIIESRLPVDAVDRVVVRQARDIESTYYLLKQFLADEELRQSVLIPIGLALLAFPILIAEASAEAALATVAAVIGLFLIYKGLGADDYVEEVPGWIRRSLYSGRVSIVTYVVAAGLAVIGLFAGVLGVSGASGSPFLLGMQFLYNSVPWLAMAALVGSMGRLIDEGIRGGYVPGAYLNIPFGVVAVGVVTHGFAGYFLQQAGMTAPIVVPPIEAGPLSLEALALTPGQRLAVFVFLGLLISITGVRVATYFGDLDTEEFEAPESIDR